MPHTKSVKMIAACVIAAIGSSSRYAQSQSIEIAIPTIVINVQQMAAATSNSSATFILYNGGSAVSLQNAGGDIIVHRPTDIRFIFASNTGDQYAPIGITFQQKVADTANGADAVSIDQSGRRNFPARTVADTVLTLHANATDPVRFKYSILFERRSDGAIGVIDPEVINVPEPHPT